MPAATHPSLPIRVLSRQAGWADHTGWGCHLLVVLVQNLVPVCVPEPLARHQLPPAALLGTQSLRVRSFEQTASSALLVSDPQNMCGHKQRCECVHKRVQHTASATSSHPILASLSFHSGISHVAPRQQHLVQSVPPQQFVFRLVDILLAA